MTIPDGHTDYIDCGAGDDEAFINISIDIDIAKNCEQLCAGLTLCLYRYIPQKPLIHIVNLVNFTFASDIITQVHLHP